MDERTTQIREGAGQVESKLNVEFIEWLRKWHMPILLVVALLALGWVGYQRWQAAKTAEVGRAFAELNAAQSPEALRSIAANYEGIRSVAEIARLRAGDIYFQAYRRGVKPAAEPQADGSFAAEDLLSQGDRESMLSQAEDLYRRVLSKTSKDQGKALLAVGASFGLAAAAEAKGDLEAARTQYEETARLAEWGGHPTQAAVARERIQKLPELANAPRLYASSELPQAPALEPPQVPGTFDPSQFNIAPAPMPEGDGQAPEAGAPPTGGDDPQPALGEPGDQPATPPAPPGEQ